MKESIYESLIKSVQNFENPKDAIKYYQYMLDNNKENSVYPKELREVHKGLIIGLKYHIIKEE